MIYFFVFIFGLVTGSFLNVLIDRLPNDESILGRSYCDHCRKELQWVDLIPVLSFFILKGKCRYCRKKISWQYPIVEIITGLLFLLIFNEFSNLSIFKIESLNHWKLIIKWLLEVGLFSSLIVIFFTDVKYQIIPDQIQLILLFFAIFYCLTTPYFTPTRCNSGCYIALFVLLLHYFIAGIIVCLPILMLYLITRGRGMGFGDVKLSFVIGFLLDWQKGLLSLYFAFILGAIIGLILIFLKKKKLKSKVAFGPFIVVGTTIMLFWGENIIGLIKKIYGL